MIPTRASAICPLLPIAMAIAFWVIAPTAIILITYVRTQLIKSYGWGVFFRYPLSYVHGPLLSPLERTLHRLGVVLIYLCLAVILGVVVTSRVVSCGGA